jgi:transcription initiation factor TFIIF subunit beta
MIRGKVEQECQLKPIMNEEYRNVMKQRNLEANRPRRSVQMVDSTSSGIRVGLIPHVNESELLLKKKRKFEPELRKERLPKAEVMDLVFKAFEKFAHWTLKGLVEHTQQPTVSIFVLSLLA